MTFSAFSRVILLKDLPDENLMAGDLGAIVEYHPGTKNYPEGYEVEFFTGNGDTLAVVSITASDLRPVTSQDVMHVRHTSMV